jgi:hypothetical protein
VLHGILSGKFYIVPNSQCRQVPQLKKVSGLEVDSSLNQPMSKSLMEGAYYHNPYENLPQTARSSKDFIQRNRAMSRHYSRLVSGARSVNASEMADRPMGTPRITGPFMRTGRPASKSMRAMAKDMPTPRNADQLQALWLQALWLQALWLQAHWLQLVGLWQMQLACLSTETNSAAEGA